jgi:hypothetical protein
MRALVLFLFFSLFQLHIAPAQQSRLVPDFATLQYAGSIGFLSVGAGYNVFGKHALSFHYGYVPKSKGGELNIFASKLVFNLLTFRTSDRITIEALNAGLMLSYHFGSEFRSRWPGQRYPEGYYWWKTSLKAHLLVQSAVTFQLDKKSRIHSLTGFIEFNTNELYLISLVQNRRSLRPADIIKLGYGLRATF